MKSKTTRLAIVDMGTNTFHLLVFEANQYGHFQIINKSKSAVKLGEGGIQKGYIEHAPFQRAMRTLERFKRLTRFFKCESVFVFATSAVRKASNQAEFLGEIKSSFDWEVEILDGNKEADFIYQGVKKAINLDSNAQVIMDIGGGSVEFCIADETGVLWKRSHEIGVSWLLQTYPPSDPITKSEIDKLESFFKSELPELIVKCKEFNVKSLIGSSGSFDTFAELIAFKYYSSTILKNKVSFDFKMEDFHKIADFLIASTLEERNHTKGILKMRLEMIVIAAILTRWVVKNCEITAMQLSTYALKEGLMDYSVQQFLAKPSMTIPGEQ